MGFFKKIEKMEKKSPEQSSEQSSGELADLRKATEVARIPKSVSALASRELDRLERMDPSIPEYSIGVSYLEFLVSLPWQNLTDDNLDIALAEKKLEIDHYGLKHVKERILEYLAVKTLCSLNEFNILVVDDEEIARTNLEHVLRKEGYQVSTAINGRDALDKL